MNQPNNILTGSFLYTEREYALLLLAEPSEENRVKMDLYFLHNVSQAVIEPELVRGDLWLSGMAAIEKIDGVTGTAISNEGLDAVFGWTNEGEVTYDLEFLDGTNLSGILKRNEETYIDEWLECLRGHA